MPASSLSQGKMVPTAVPRLGKETAATNSLRSVLTHAGLYQLVADFQEAGSALDDISNSCKDFGAYAQFFSEGQREV